MTLSALAMKIFRLLMMISSFLPNRNEERFIRRGYNGGHTDVLKPYGEHLYYYDVNSLYPSCCYEILSYARWCPRLDE